MNTLLFTLIGFLLVGLWLQKHRRAQTRRFDSAAFAAQLAQDEAEFQQIQRECKHQAREYRKQLRELSQDSQPKSQPPKSPRPPKPKTPKPLTSQSKQRQTLTKDAGASFIESNRPNTSNDRTTTLQSLAQSPSIHTFAHVATIRTRPSFLSGCFSVVHSSASYLLRPARFIARAISRWFFHHPPRPPQANQAPIEVRINRAA